MRLTAIIFLAMLACLSCKKETGSGSLDGKWKMIKYYDRSTSSLNTKPDTSENVFLVINGDNFTAFSGSKPICDGTFLLNGDGITFTAENTYFAFITNDLWTDMFSWAIHACHLQSVYPCSPSTLHRVFPNQIRINTPLRMDVILMKVQ